MHQGERDYFEWIRVLEAMSNGCLVVTERSGGYAPLVPGRTSPGAGRRRWPAQVDAILRDEALRAELALNAYEFVRKNMDWVDNVDRLLTLVERRLSRGLRRRRPRCLGAATCPRRSAVPVEAACHRSASVGDRARRSKSQVSALFDQAEAHEKQGRSMIKDIMLAEVNDSRLIEATIAALEHGSQEYAQVSDTAGYLRATPEVSVVLTHYNYSAFVREAIESVVASTGVRSGARRRRQPLRPEELHHLRSVIAEYEWFPIRLVANAADQGPSASRNIGARHARAAHTPPARRRQHALPRRGPSCCTPRSSQSDAAFAYGLIEKFGDDTGLLSAVPWNVEHLVHSNYIDTMALIRHEVWDEFGGFDPQVAAMGGYDDYAFWLQLAAAGYRGELVSSFIGRYRVHGTSLQSLLNLNTTEFMQFYRERHPSLPWPALEGS